MCVVSYLQILLLRNVWLGCVSGHKGSSPRSAADVLYDLGKVVHWLAFILSKICCLSCISSDLNCLNIFDLPVNTFCKIATFSQYIQVPPVFNLNNNARSEIKKKPVEITEKNSWLFLIVILLSWFGFHNFTVFCSCHRHSSIWESFWKTFPEKRNCFSGCVYVHAAAEGIMNFSLIS